MPKVYLPLGSQAASGKMGEMFVYQGTTVRALVVPNDPRTAAQLDVRKIFSDVTKTVKTGGLWAKGALATELGPRWYTLIYKAILQYQDLAQTEWDGLNSTVQGLWSENAPYLATWNEPGRVFFGIYWAMCLLDLDAFGFLEELEDDPVSARALWDRDLTDVILKGLYENGVGAVTISGGWSIVTDAAASGGSYKNWAGPGDGSYYLYFKGTECILTFLKGSSWGGIDIRLDGVFQPAFTQYNSSTIYGQSWTTGVLHDGLHYLQVNSHVTGLTAAAHNLDVVEVMGKSKSRTKKETSGNGELVIPAGMIFSYAGATAPAGWLACDGSSVLRTDYPTLFGVLGVTYGAVDGGHFNLPDMRGRVPVGAGIGAGDGASGTGAPTGTALSTRTLGDWFGKQLHTLSSSEMPSHTHTQNSHNHTQDQHTHTQNSHNHTQDAHTHTQNSHNHTQDAHTHTQNSHNHTQDSHNHLQDQHTHPVLGRDSSTAGTGNRAMNASATGATHDPASGGATATNQAATATNQAATATNQNTTATNQAATATSQNTTATNQAATPTNQNATATNQAATATNQNAGGDGAHNNLQPSLVVNFIIKT